MTETKADKVSFDIKTGTISFDMEIPKWTSEMVESNDRSKTIDKNWDGISAEIWLSIYGRKIPTKISPRLLDSKVAISASKLGYHCPELVTLSNTIEKMSPYDVIMVEPCVHILFRTPDRGHVWDSRSQRNLEWILPVKL